MAEKKVVMFDLDGTVLDTLPDIARSANFALKSLGYLEQSIEDVRTYIGHGIRNLLKDLMGCDDEETLAKCRDIFQEHYDKNKAVATKPYAGIKDILIKLKFYNNYNIYIISNKYERATKELVSEFFGDLFDGVYGSRDDMPPKPDRAIFDLVCQSNGLDKDGIVYVGDSEVDLEFAQNCGMKFIAVSWGFRDRDTLISAGAETVVDSVEELGELLLKS